MRPLSDDDPEMRSSVSKKNGGTMPLTRSSSQAPKMMNAAPMATLIELRLSLTGSIRNPS
jgi:hypothetical protein